ncbi:MAG TPA: TRAP transporter substrate-binding protein DctP [Polyangiaceae bacterium]|jgi:TRAP-type C4-dicarboxylate transport system substrate-binding protein
MSFKRLVLAAAAIIAAFSAAGDAQADATNLKVGTLAPGDSPWGQVFKVWKRAVEERSGGNLQLQFFWNGTQGDENAMVGKIRTGQLDGAAITAVGLGQIYKQVLVLQLPGLFTDWGKLDSARNQMRAGFDQQFDQQGFKILGWGDVGRAHVLSKGFGVHVPDDLKHKNTFYLPGDPIQPMLYSLIGDVTPRQMGVPEILPGLTNGSINVVVAPALAAEQLQWASRLDNINTAVAGVGIGALVFSSAKIRSLPADAQNVLIQTGAIAGSALTTRIRREDDAAFARLKARMTTYDPNGSDIAAWQKVFADTRARLRGTVFNPQVFDEAVRYAQ